MKLENEQEQQTRSRRLYSITIPAKDVLRVGAAEGSSVRMPGFRPGKVPAALIRKMHGPKIEALTKEMEDGITSLIQEHQRKLADKSDFEAPQELHVQLELATLPASATRAADSLQDEKQALLDLAGSGESADGPDGQHLEDEMRAAAFKMLGGSKALGRQIRSEEELIEAIASGFPSAVLNFLRDAGWPAHTLEKVVAPKRTLMRRKAGRQRLTPGESDATWRLAATLASATKVLNGQSAALAWLMRPKPSLSGRTPVELLKSGVGTAYVQSLLNRLDWGDIA
jgi:putative toxin-antitoxin system antitoxin component (TIGR02293 family)